MQHKLNVNERQLLSTVFKQTLPYDSIVCKVNTLKTGPKGNSITIAGTPHFDAEIYCGDFSEPSVLKNENYKVSIFFHEMTHVWQYFHGISVWRSAAQVLFDYHFKYGEGYPYSLRSGRKFSQFNIEQQASIVEDYWRLTQSQPPPYVNTDPNPTLSEYRACIDELQHSGPPKEPQHADYDVWTESPSRGP
jgi:type VI secretion system secreted protein VgrG